MTSSGRPLCRDLAMRQLRGWKGANARRHNPFTGTGIPKSTVAAKPAITLRRADYEKKREAKEQ